MGKRRAGGLVADHLGTESAGGRAKGSGRILLVEDDREVGRDVQEMFEKAGYEVLGPVTTVATALAIIMSSKLDAALVDLNLSGEKSYAVADALVARSIPFVITSGYLNDDLPEKYRQHPLLSKPFLPRELLRYLKQAIDPSA
jgi:CheY-like chemotaxis protein